MRQLGDNRVRATVCAAIATLTLVCVLMLPAVMVPMSDVGGGVVARTMDVSCGIADTVTAARPAWTLLHLIAAPSLDVTHATRVLGEQQPPLFTGASPPHLLFPPLRT